MYRYVPILAALCTFTLSTAPTQAKPDDNPDTSVPTITVTKLDVTDKTLEVNYQIKNGSENDIWICEDVDSSGFEAYLAEDGQTLMIRRRLDVPMVGYAEQPFGRYVRLRTGQKRSESFLLSLPANLYNVFSGSGRTQETVHAGRLLLEIGYYTGDLPAMICSVLEKAEKISDKNEDEDLADIKKHMGGLLYFNRHNEDLSQRDERVIVAYTFQALKGEHVLSVQLDGQKIPYIGNPPWPGFKPPDLSRCTRVEIRYQPSMLDYFFPYDGQRSLLSRVETEYLHSEKPTIVDDPEDLKTLVSDICASEGDYCPGGMVCEGSMAHVVSYRDRELLTSFTVYDDTSIETEQKQRIKYHRVLQCLRKLTPNIEPLELRMQCAANVTNLYHRFRLYHKAQESRPAGSFLRVRWDRWRFYQKAKKAYPAPTKWCDAMEWAYGISGIFGEGFERSFRCPNAGEGKCHYAMNANCKPESPPDMVLLFETKAGWNQHGGPELFTFDNHNPKGGCVLLNDGTAKFIRTAEELQQLRWK